MPKNMQIDFLKRIYKGTANFSWEHEVDSTLSLPENRIALSIKFPNGWFANEIEAKDVKNEAIKEYHDYLDYLLESAVLPEAREGMGPIFEKALSDYRYRMERNLERATLRKTITKLGEQLLEAKRMGKPQKDIIEEEKRKDIQEQERPKVRMTDDLKTRLKRLFEATYTKETGKSPSKFLSEFWTELESQIPLLSSEEEMKAAVIDLALEIVGREEARERLKKKELERPPPERPPKEAIIGLPPEEEEEKFFITAPPAAFPMYPEKPFKTELYPNRSLTASEIEDIWDVFTEAVYMCGKKPDRYYKEFNAWIENFLFDSWEQVKSNYQNLIDIICYEKKVVLVPRALPAEVLDELIHWITSIDTIEDFVDNKKIMRKPETIEDVIVKLEQMGKPGVPPSDVIAAVKRGWKEKAPNYVIVTKQYLEKLLGEPLE